MSLKHLLLTGSILILSMAVGCASGTGPRKATHSKDEEMTDDDTGISGNPNHKSDDKKVCGWTDTGRWECSESRGPLDKKEKTAAPPKKLKTRKEIVNESEDSKLPRGDKPFDASPVDDGLGGSSGE